MACLKTNKETPNIGMNTARLVKSNEEMIHKATSDLVSQHEVRRGDPGHGS